MRPFNVRASRRKPFRAGAVLAFLFAVSPSLAGPRVALDAAHGGDDPGLKAGGYTEKDWDLRIAQALSKALDQAGFNPLLIRKKDETLNQDQRDQAVNTAQASVALVLHLDQEWSGRQRGPLVVVQPPNRPEAGGGDLPLWGFISPNEYHASLRLARSLARALGAGVELSTLSDGRGTAGERTSEGGRILCLPHTSLRNLTPPAVVLEPYFLSSTEDRKLLSDSKNVQEFVAKVVEGLRDYFQMNSPAPPASSPVPGPSPSPMTEATPEPTPAGTPL